MDVRWLLAQVAVPVAGPILIAGCIAFLWSLGKPEFEPDLWVIVDITPCALTFFNLALISTTLSAVWSRISARAFLVGATITVGVIIATLHAFTVVWRHDADHAPKTDVYSMTFALTAISASLCNRCMTRSLATPSVTPPPRPER